MYHQSQDLGSAELQKTGMPHMSVHRCCALAPNTVAITANSLLPGALLLNTLLLHTAADLICSACMHAATDPRGVHICTPDTCLGLAPLAGNNWSKSLASKNNLQAGCRCRFAESTLLTHSQAVSSVYLRKAKNQILTTLSHRAAWAAEGS